MPARRKHKSSRSVKLEELKRRLAEAVETLEAIRSGAVDALVVHGPRGEQVFTLRGADQVYRTLVEAMNEGAVSLNREQTVLYCNNRFSELIRTPLEKITGMPFASLAALRERSRLTQFLEESFKERGTYETVLLTAASTEVTVHLSTNPVAIDEDFGLSVVITDISERKQLEIAQRELARQIVSAQEQERHRVSRELHDGINQLLSSARHRVHAIEKSLRHLKAKSVLEQVAETRDLLERTIQEVRRISRNLRPSELDDLGLVPALHSLVDEFQKRTHIEVKIRSQLHSRIVNKQAEVAAYRIVQEAFNNIERHARASHIDLLLLQTNGSLSLRVRDNGRGFDTRRVEERGFGLANMRERAIQGKGNLWWKSAPGKGTEVCLIMPL